MGSSSTNSFSISIPTKHYFLSVWNFKHKYKFIFVFILRLFFLYNWKKKQEDIHFVTSLMFKIIFFR